MDTRIKLSDYNNNKYIFDLYPIGNELDNFAGLYTFCYYCKNNRGWIIVYIGQTGDFSDRIDDNLLRHHKLKCSLKKGATHIGIYSLQGGKAPRKLIEKELILYYKPPCNEKI